MDSFTLEVRPRASVWNCLPDGFVAESRPSSRRTTHFNEDTTLVKAVFSENNTNSNTPQYNTQHNGHQDLAASLNNILSNKSFTTPQLIAVMENSIVTLIHTLLKECDIRAIYGIINVSLTGSDQPIAINIKESYCNNSTNCQSPDSVVSGLKFKRDPKSPLRSPIGEGRLSAEESTHFGDLLPLYRENVFMNYPDASPGSLHSMNREGPSPTYTRLSSEEPDKMERSDEERLRENAVCTMNPKTFHSLEVPHKSSDASSTCASSNIIDSYSEEPRLIINQQQNNKSLLENHNTIVTGSLEKVSECQMDTESNSSTSAGLESCVSTPSYNNVTLNDDSSAMDLTENTIIFIDNEDEDEVDENSDDTVTETTLLVCKHQQCSAQISGIENYKQHALSVHQLYACSICLKHFSSKNNMKRHQRIHTGARPYKCSQCNLAFSRKDDLKGHILKHDYNKPFRCSICKKGYTDRTCVKNHMSKEHCSRVVYICPQCGESFDRETLFLEHKQSHPSLKQFSCSTCAYVGTNHLMALKHELLHTHKLFSCKPCNAYFSDPFGYTKHVRKHKKNGCYTSYVCCFCDMEMTTYDQFVRHEYAHAQSKLYECDVCNKQFKSKMLMMEHCSSHGNQEKRDNENLSSEVFGENEVKEMEMDNNSTEEDSDTHSVITTVKFSENRKDFDESDLQTIKSPKQAIEDKDIEPPDMSQIEETKMPCLMSSFELHRSASQDGLALDLSMNSRNAEYLSYSEQNCASVAKSTTSDVDSCGGLVCRSDNCVPRNGYANFDSYHPGQKTSSECCWDSAKNQFLSEQDIYHVVWDSSRLHQQLKETRNSSLNPDFNQVSVLPNAQLVDESQITLKRNRIKMMQREGNHDLQTTGNFGKTVRHHPYAKHFELLSKFFAARGGVPNRADTPLREIGNNQSKLAQILEPVSGSKTNGSYQPCSNILSVHSTLPQPALSSEQSYQHPSTDQMPELMIPTAHNSPNKLPKDTTHKCTKQQSILKLKQKPLDSDIPPLTTAWDTASRSCEKVRNKPAESVLVSPPETIRHCDICQISFQTFAEMESHSVVHHNRFLCEFCGRSFSARPNRDRHVRYHTGVKPYKCELCPSAFFRGDDLKYHRTTKHPTDQINCPKCTASFTWQKDLDKHLRHARCIL